MKTMPQTPLKGCAPVPPKKRFLIHATERWTYREIVLSAVVISLLLAVLTSNVNQSGAWDGDPALRNRLSMETVNVFVSELQNGGAPAKAFLQSFHRFPTMLHEIMLANFILVVNGINRVSFDTVSYLAAWFSTLWTLVGVCVLYFTMRRFASRQWALLVLPAVALAGYIIFYANFPRQNMAAHVTGWIAFYVYLRGRIAGNLSIGTSLAVGLLYGVAFALHYSSAYLLFAFLACEFVFTAISPRHSLRALSSVAVIFASSVAVWFAIDFYFYLMLAHYDVVLFDGTNLAAKNWSFLSGLIFSMTRLSAEAAAWKLEETKWWFIFGFLYRNFGLVGSFLMACGFLTLPWQLINAIRSDNLENRNLFIIIFVTTLMSMVVSLEYFQNARKLMVFYPAWCVLLLLGFSLITRIIWWAIQCCRTRLLIGYSEFKNMQIASPGLFAVAVLLIGLHFVLFAPDTRAIYRARRDVGYMREYLKKHRIDRVLIYTNCEDFTNSFAPIQKVPFRIPRAEADQFEYVLVHKLYRDAHGDLMRRLRNITPVVSFPNQASLPIFWYEFPVKSKFADFNDPLTHSRLLYRWRDVKSAFYPEQ